MKAECLDLIRHLIHQLKDYTDTESSCSNDQPTE
jgi:hypothetical protein